MRQAIVLFFLACAGPKVSQADPAAVSSVMVHLTIDDLPWQIEAGHRVPHTATEIAKRNRRLVGELSSRGVQASVFVNCERLQPGDGTVAMWRDARHTIGNHTHSHARLAKLTPEAWLADARRCHDILAAQLDAGPSWLRYPYLGYGDGEEARDAVTAGLSEMGERNAPVTVPTAEWVYAYAYRRALRTGDEALRAEVAADYHRYMDEALEASRRLARDVVGREVPQTVLVHINELAVEQLGVLIDRWSARGVVFVDLDTAMADPVFAMENHFTGRWAVSWLSRIRQNDWNDADAWFGKAEYEALKRFGSVADEDKGVPMVPRE